MKKILLIPISLLSNISFLIPSTKANTQIPMPWLLPWLIIYLILISILFWLFYKAIKTKKKKYRYMIIFTFILMVILTFFPI